MRRFTLRFSLLGLLLFPALMACASASASVLKDTTWKLESYTDAQGQSVSALPEAKATMEFTPDQINGTTGCNSYFASYSMNGDKLTLGPAGATEMACQEPRMAQEGAFLAALSKVASYRLNGGRLDLLDAAGKVLLTFSELKPLPLEGTSWVMTSVNNGQGGVVSALQGVDVTAIFEKGGIVSGKAGCNSYSGEYKTDGDKIKVSQTVSTLMACDSPQGVMEQEANYLRSLTGSAVFKIRGSTLNLYDASGAVLVSFNAAP